ncbi:MAG TPA: CBS domain-containing protein [Mycobacteriales bacterium]|nr:CBS domain-containing protein [Mycobacteriales bacterium]
MQVADIMTSASVTDSPNDSLRSAAETMWKQQTGSLLVMSGERLVGIITERDVMKAVARGRDMDATTVAEIMTADVMTVEPATSPHEAARAMASRWIRHLPVVDAGKVVGVVSQRDLVGVFAALVQSGDGATLSSDALVREQRLARIEHGDLD